MTTALTAVTRRGKQDVAVELAACVVAIQQCVGKVLSEQHPRIGHIDEQANSAFAARAKQWSAMTLPVAREAVASAPGPIVGSSRRARIDLARSYAADLGACIDTEAATALAAAMDLQLAKGHHPDVAWQRAVAGYGLAAAAMRGYIAAAIRTGGDMPVLLATSKKSAQRALLAQADRIGEREATAWSTLPVETVDKRFDPSQTRDRNGQWSAEPTAGAMAETLAADTTTYPDVIWRPFSMNKVPRQAAARKKFEGQYGKLGFRVTAAVDDWINHPGVSRARHIEHGTHDRSPWSRFKQYRMTPNHRLLIDMVNAAPSTKSVLYRGGSYADASALQKGAVLNLPLTSFSATPAGAERFAWLGAYRKAHTPVVFELAPGARALNLTPLTTWGSSPNEWIANGRFKVMSARPERREIRFDPEDREGKVHDILLVRLKHLPHTAPVSKTFDPHQRRDGDGQWTAGSGGTRPRKLTPEQNAWLADRAAAHDAVYGMSDDAYADNPYAPPVGDPGKLARAYPWSAYPRDANPRSKPRLKLRERGTNSAVDELLNSTPVEAPVEAPVATPAVSATNPWAAANPWASAVADPWTGAANPWETPTENPWATPAKNPWVPKSDDPWAPKESVHHTIVRRVFLFGLKAPDEVPPEVVVEQEEEQAAAGFGMYVPLQDLAGYYRSRGGSTPDAPRDVVDFGAITEYYRDVQNTAVQVELRTGPTSTPWGQAQGVEGIEPDAWSNVLRKAVPLHREILDNLPDIAARLDQGDLSVAADRAGYPTLGSKAAIVEKIELHAGMRDRHQTEMVDENGKKIYRDDGLLNALADYLIWDNPELLGDQGKALRDELENRINARPRVDLGDDPPDVLAFPFGPHPDEDTARLQGRYVVTRLKYHSAIAELGYGAPLGKVSLREIYMVSEPN